MYTVLLLFQVNAMFSAADWLFSGIPMRFPDLKIVLSEGGVGWVPSILDRLDHQHRYQDETLLRDTWPHTDVSPRSEEHTSELQSLMRISYAVFCLKKKHTQTTTKYKLRI